MTVNRNVSSSPPNWIQRIAYQYSIIQHYEVRIYAYLGRLRINLAGLSGSYCTVPKRSNTPGKSVGVK